nr:uncharacterized protein LOC129283702 [Lytechinus pictus]
MLASGDVVQLELTEGKISAIPSGFNALPVHSKQFYCAEPFLQSLRLVGGNETEGRLVVTSQADPTNDLLVHQRDWPKNASRFVCKYLGYEGAYATVGGDLFEISSSPNNFYDAVSVGCPANMNNITRCWYKRIDWKVSLDKSIAIVCCTCEYPKRCDFL